MNFDYCFDFGSAIRLFRLKSAALKIKHFDDSTGSELNLENTTVVRGAYMANRYGSSVGEYLFNQVLWCPVCV